MKTESSGTSPTALILILSIISVMIAFATSIADAHGFPSPGTFAPALAAAALYGPLFFFARRLTQQRGWQISTYCLFIAFLAGLAPLALNLPYIWYRSGAASASSVDFIANKYTVTAELLLGAFLVLVMARLLSAGKGAVTEEGSTERPWAILVPVVFLWVIAGSILSILMHHFMHEPGPNTTMVVQAFGNVFDDRGPLYAKVLQADGSSILGIHANFIYFLIYPFYVLLPRYETILTLGQIGMAIAVIPLYKLSRLVLSYKASLLLVFAFLVNPVIAGSGPTQDMSELRFLAFPFFFSLFFFMKGRFLPFSAFALLAISIREDVALLYVLLGIYALFTKRGWMWGIIPIAFGGCWFVAMSNYVIPHYNPAGSFTRLEVVYEEYGGSQTGLIRYLLTHPWYIFSRIFANASTTGLTYGIWQTIGLGIPVLSGLAMLSLPGFAELLLLESGTRVSINSHHAIIVAVPLFAALVYGLARLGRWNIFPISHERRTLIIAVFVFFSGLSAFHVWFNPGRYEPRYNYDEARELLAMVPDDGSVILPMYLLIHSKDTQDAVGYYQIAYRVDQGSEILQEDYVIIDTRIPEDLKNLRVYKGLESLMAAIGDDVDYEELERLDDLILYARKGAIVPKAEAA